MAGRVYIRLVINKDIKPWLFEDMLLIAAAERNGARALVYAVQPGRRGSCLLGVFEDAENTILVSNSLTALRLFEAGGLKLAKPARLPKNPLFKWLVGVIRRAADPEALEDEVREMLRTGEAKTIVRRDCFLLGGSPLGTPTWVVIVEDGSKEWCETFGHREEALAYALKVKRDRPGALIEVFKTAEAYVVE